MAFPKGSPITGAGGALTAALRAAEGAVGTVGGSGREEAGSERRGEGRGESRPGRKGAAAGAGARGAAAAAGGGAEEEEEDMDDDNDDGTVRDDIGGGRKRGRALRGSCVRVITAVRPLLPHEVGCTDIVSSPSPSMVRKPVTWIMCELVGPHFLRT